MPRARQRDQTGRGEPEKRTDCHKHGQRDGARAFSDQEPVGPVEGGEKLGVFLSYPYGRSARWYDPASGRFITEDSVTGNQYSALSLNRYIYADDDPMTLVDPTGHMIAEDGKEVGVVTRKSVEEQTASGETTVTTVTVVPISDTLPPPSTPSVTQSNIAPQTSTGTAASPPSGSVAEDIIASAKQNQAATTGSSGSTYTPSSSMPTQTSTSTTVESTDSNPPGTIQLPPGQTAQGYNKAISTADLLIFNGVAGILVGAAISPIPIVGWIAGPALVITQLGGIFNEGVYEYNGGYGITQQGAIQAYGQGEEETIPDVIKWFADHF
jgi:RHS repeat-associated protein